MNSNIFKKLGKRANQNVYLKVENKANPPKRISSPKTKYYANRNTTNKVTVHRPAINKITYPSKNDYIDLTHSCDYLFQYIHDNKCINKNYYNTSIVLTYLTLIIISTLILLLIGITRPNGYAYKYICFQTSTSSYGNCSSRNFCTCDVWTKCINACYSGLDSCISFYEQNSMTTVTKQDILFKSGSILNVHYDANNKNLNLFVNMNEGSCNVEWYILYIISSHYFGGLLGMLILALISDKYGKRYSILISNIILLAGMVFMVVYSQNTFTDYNSVAYFLAVWIVIGFLLGFSLYSLKDLICLQYLESYSNVGNLTLINGFLHSHFAFSGVLYYIINSVIQNYAYFIYFCIPYFLFFVIFYFIYFSENPRFYSERKNYIQKKKAFERYMSKILISKKKDANEEEKFWKVIVLFDSNCEEIKDDQVVKKRVEPGEESVGFLNKPRNADGSPRMQRRNSPTKKNIKVGSPKSKKSNSFKENGKAVNIELKILSGEDDKHEKERESISKIQKKIRGSETQRKGSKPKFASISSKNEDVNIIKTVFARKTSVSIVMPLKVIFKRYKTDEFLRKYYLIFIIVWMALSYCYYGTAITSVIEINNPNMTDDFRTPFLFIYSVFMSFFMPILIGFLTFYFNPQKVMLPAIFIFTLLSLLWDSQYIYPDVERMTYFGSDRQQKNYEPHPYNLATSQFLILVLYSIFDLMTITSSPSLYRTIFYSAVKCISMMTALIAYCSFYILDSPSLNLGIVSLFTFLVFLAVDARWREPKLREYSDVENDEQKRSITKMKINKSINNEIIPTKRSRVNSTFSRVRNFSYKKIKK